jgi:hypothetical protein
MNQFPGASVSWLYDYGYELQLLAFSELLFKVSLEKTGNSYPKMVLTDQCEALRYDTAFKLAAVMGYSGGPG